jgi:hypothetical protein
MSRVEVTATVWWGRVLPSMLESGRMVAPTVPSVAGVDGR